MSFRWLAIFLFPVALKAAPMETMAWHFPKLSSCGFSSDYNEAMDAPLDAQPSLTSTFIAKNHQVNDLSVPFRKRYKLGNDSWLVWNESRKLLVAHATPITLWQIENESGYKRQPTQAAMTISWYFGVEPGKPIPPDLAPMHRSMVVGRSQQKTLQTWTSPAPSRLMSVNIESEATIGDDDKEIDADFRLDWQERFNGKTYLWHFNSSTVLGNASKAKSILTQVDSPTGGSWTLTAEGSIVLADGHPVAEGRLLELKGKEIISTEYPTFIATQERVKIQTTKGELLIQAFPAWDLVRDQDNESIPPSSTGSKIRLNEDGPQIAVIPEDLKHWFPQHLVDAKEYLKLDGINVPENGLAGFDFSSGYLFVADLNAIVVDQVEQSVTGGCYRRPHLLTFLRNLESSSKVNGSKSQKALIACLSGHKSLLICTDDDESPLFNFDVEPTIGDVPEIVELRFSSAQKEPAHEHSGSIGLAIGVAVKVSSTTTESGDQLSESLQANILPWPIEINGR